MLAMGLNLYTTLRWCLIMWRRQAGVIAAILVLAGVCPLYVSAGPPSSMVSSDPETIAHGRRLFEQHCRPCHGKKAVGENPATPLGAWTEAGPVAPALNGAGHAWHHPPEYHVRIIREGSIVKGSRMQGWSKSMSDYDMLAVIAYFQSLWPTQIKEAYAHRYLHRVWERESSGMETPKPSDSIPIGTETPAHNRPIPIGMLAYLYGPTADMLGMRDGLVELGLRQDEHVALGVRYAEGDENMLDTIVRQLVRDGAKVLYASGSKALEAAQQVTTRTPIVFTTWYNPVRQGALECHAGLGANVTGVTHAFPEVNPRALDVFRSLIPTLQRVLVPYDADDSSLVEPLQALRSTAARLGIELVERAVRSQEEVRRIIMATRRAEVDGILPVGGRWNIAGYALQASLQHHMPTMFSRAWMAEYGGLASYGPSWYGLGRRAARLVADIMRGAKPEELPIEVVQQMELVVNLRTARALGITIPPTLLSQADRVIR
jgi:putative ABC transport system substrate-binding protein